MWVILLGALAAMATLTKKEPSPIILLRTNYLHAEMTANF